MDRPQATGPATHAVKDIRAAEATPVREVAALHRFEVFLFTAIATVLVVRALLAVTGYPKIGSGGLHIAHVLWGGLFMAVAVVMGLAGMGSRIRSWAAFLGGIGFGLFIDEVGKFVTSDVNYFYRPAVAIIYLVFVGFYLTGRLILLRRPLNDRRRIALAGQAVVDQSLGQLDERHRDETLRLLDGLEHPTDATNAMRTTLLELPIARRRMQERLHQLGVRVTATATWCARNPVLQVLVFGFLVYVVVDRLREYITYLRVTIDLKRLVSALNALDPSNQAGKVELRFGFYFWYLLLANLAVAGLVAVGLALVIVPWLRRWGMRVIAWALLLDILFNQFSAFRYSQFKALSGFAIELAILLGIRYLLRTDHVPDFDRRLWRRARLDRP